MRIIAVTGRKGSGKDTAANVLHRADGEFKRLKFADPLKNMLRQLFADAGFDEATIERMIEGDLKETPFTELQGKTPRHLMQTLGTEWRDHIGKDLWLGLTSSKASTCARGGTSGIVITDMRFEHERAWAKQVGGCTVRVVGAFAPPDTSASRHPSETYIDEMPVDVELFNFGTISDAEDALFRLSERVRNCNI